MRAARLGMRARLDSLLFVASVLLLCPTECVALKVRLTLTPAVKAVRIHL